MNRLKRIITLIVTLGMMAGCELAGLEVQEKYDYDEDAGKYNNELKMTVWEFINSRPDVFSILIDGIKHAGVENMYSEPASTYLLLTDNAFNSTNPEDLSYFFTKRQVNPDYDPNNPATGGPTFMPSSLEQYPKEQVKEFLLFHIAKGSWTWSNLPPSPTWFDTYASADTAKVNLYLMKNERNPTIGFNDFPSHYRGVVRARTTNLLASNGSYVHVLDSWLSYPTRSDLNLD